MIEHQSVAKRRREETSHMRDMHLTGDQQMKSCQACPESLESGGVSTRRMQSGEKIVCQSGALWITQDSDPRDIVLGPGEVFVADRSGIVLLFAFEASAFQVEANRTGARARSRHPFAADRAANALHGA